ncbi:MAG: transcription antitermination factor NusB [Bacteroidales bacterium]|nr:transcription antitermination factor NusB [Bacteroidales bacterium]
MISRRLIRIKVLQVLYAYSKKNEGYSSNVAEKELFHSIDKFYDLYHLLLLLILEMADLEEKRIELRRNKKIQTSEDLFPSTKFVDNKVIRNIRLIEALYDYKNARKLNWKIHEDTLKRIYNDFISTEQYQNYINSDTDSFVSDKEFLNNFYSEFLAENINFSEFLEEENIYWNDDAGFAIIMVIKTIENIKENGKPGKLMPLFKNDDDKEYTKKLIRKAIVDQKEYIKLIEKHTQNWDTERIAHVDLLILQLAITELLEFPSIPVKVTMNEFIEISKYYSTERSKVFINGVLDKIVKDFESDKRLNKTGRGLIG